MIAGTDVADATDGPVTARRVVAALKRASGLLGPDAVSVPADNGHVDQAALEESVDAALAALSGLVMSYTGPDALEVARTSWRTWPAVCGSGRSTGACMA
jgi:hypothetical protein